MVRVAFYVVATGIALASAGCTTGQGLSSSFAAHNEVAAEPTAPGSLPRPRPKTAATPTESASPYEELIARYAAENGVPLPLALAVVEHESGFNARATGKGTIGLMQIKPATARGIGFSGSTEELYDPETNLAWGMKYLGGAYKLGGGDVCGTALRYQGGHRATKMTDSTRRYCTKLKSLM